MKRNERKQEKKEKMFVEILISYYIFHRVATARNEIQNAKTKAMWEPVGDRERVERVFDACLQTAEQYCAMQS